MSNPKNRPQTKGQTPLPGSYADIFSNALKRNARARAFDREDRPDQPIRTDIR